MKQYLQFFFMLLFITGYTCINPPTAKAKINKLKINSKKKSFFKCIQKGDIDKVKLFLDGGMDPNLLDYNEFTPLICAIESNQPKIVELLINNGSDVNLKLEAFWGTTESENMFRPTASPHLVWLKAKPLIATKKGWTPLMHATVKRCIQIVKLLLTHQADVNIRTYRGDSALLMSINKNRDITDLLLKNGADINVCSDTVCINGVYYLSVTPLSIAVNLKDFNLVNYLLCKGANLNDGENIFITLGRHNIQMLKYLLKIGANPNKANPKTGSLPIVAAATSGTIKELELLIKYGADVNLREKDEFNSTALIWAAFQGRKDSVAFLIKNGADVNIECKAKFEDGEFTGPGRTALIGAIKSGYADIVELLLQKGAKDNYKTVNGDTILSLAEKKLKTAIKRYKHSTKSSREDNPWIEKNYINYKKIVQLLRKQIIKE